jgi:hypothetical protein
MKWTQQRDRAQALIQKIQECETECHAIGFTRAAHSINAAKNAVGWDLADAAKELLRAQSDDASRKREG